MNVLQINKFYWHFGGPERVMFETADLLRRHGHHVEFFAMDHPRNLDSDNAEFFVSNIDYRSGWALYNPKNLLRSAGKTIYSLASKKKMRALLAGRNVDVAHVHMIEHQISPSVLHALREFDIPTVHTCHDHKLVCPASHLYIEPRHEVCERCVVSRRYYNVARYRCMRGSLGVSTLAGIAEYLHRWTGIYEKNIDIFIAPSQFLAGRLAAGGIPEKQIRVIPNGINLSEYEPCFEAGGYVVCFSRLSAGKGIPTLIEAAARVPHIPFVLAGEGPMQDELERLAVEKSLKNVRFVGYKAQQELRALVRNAALVVLPSECHENCPMVTLEAYALGKPVVVTRMGGAPENVDDGETGFLVEPKDAAQLAKAIQQLFEDKPRCETMGRRGRTKVERLCADFYDKTLEAYEEARAMHQ